MTISLSESDDGSTIQLRVGDAVVIRLPENATTGYRWSVAQPDGVVLDVSGPDADHPGGAIGSGGHTSFTIAARSPGSASVRLVYARPWEGPDAAAKRFGIDVTVVPA